jgi:Flp pilus assembly protein TadG
MSSFRLKTVVAAATRLADWRASLRRFFFEPNDGARGVAAIELGLIAPILALMLVASFDVGMGIYRGMQVQTAAQAGAQYAVAHGFSTSIANVVTGATSYSGISASPAPSRFCGCPSSSSVTAATCSSTCSNGSVAGTYVTVSSQATYSTILPYPIVPNSYALSSQSTVRIQ